MDLDAAAECVCTHYHAASPIHSTVKVVGTSCEIHDRYLLAKLAWEQEQALAAACKEVGE